MGANQQKKRNAVTVLSWDDAKATKKATLYGAQKSESLEKRKGKKTNSLASIEFY